MLRGIRHFFLMRVILLLQSTYSPMWAGAPNARVEPTANDTLELKSTSANDAFPAGTGALGVIVVYVDSDYVEHTTAPIFLNGTTLVSGPTDFFRLNRILVIATGTTGYNEGTIEAYANSGTDLQGAVQVYADGVGMGQSADGYYTIPAGKQLVGRDIFPPAEFNVATLARSAIKLESGPELRGIEIPFYQETQTIPLVTSFPLPEKATVWFEGKITNGAGPTPIMWSAAFNEIDSTLTSQASGLSAMSMCEVP